MPRNPMLSRGRDAQNTGVNSPDRSSEPHKSYIQRNNDFDLSYAHLATLRFADVHPFFAIDALPADKLPFRSLHELRSYTLQSPMLSDIKMHKSFTMVPMQAILPNSWDRFIVNPTRGDDVPDDVYCQYTILGKVMEFVSSYVPTSDVLTKSSFFTKVAIVLESVFSSGSLLAALGIDFSKLWPDFDLFFDTDIVPMLRTLPIRLVVDYGTASGSFAINEQVASSSSSIYVDNMHDALDFLRDGCEVHTDVAIPTSFIGEDLNNILDVITMKMSAIYDPNVDLFDYAFDISKPLAYQLSCIQIMTDDSIDDIYTPNLFRQIIYEYTFPSFFTYNGSPIQYDAFSQHILESLDSSSQLYDLFTLLFSFRKSLKYGDYFIDARPQPYSVGDLSVEVNDGQVNIIDTTRKTLAQRFLNWSNRVGNKLHEYILALTGVVPTATTDEPKYIIHEVFDVSGFEVENTADGQRDDVSVTTQLKTQDSRYMFDIEINEYCVILGLAHFDVKRIYTGRVDRSNLKSNRFDFFNKFFQYAGDQDIKRIELSAAIGNSMQPMAYTTRHMQYKTGVSQAVGGFANGTLPSWAFVNDESSDVTHGITLLGINSDFIRNHNGEFDRFYTSLTGFSLGTYFHFIVKFTNVCDMSRQMAIAPDIL